jgi:23S rRNA pseudouridine2457 synthase
LLFQGEVPHKRVYLIRVNGVVNSESLEQLRTGVHIRIEEGKDYLTPPCVVNIVEPPAFLLPYQLQQYHIPHTWLTMELYEGKYHQVRKMVSAVRHQCKRLIRLSIEDLQLGDLAPGGVREIGEEEFFGLLNIRNWKEPAGI